MKRIGIRALLTILGVVLASTESRAVEPDASERPHIVFILCDDLGFGDMGCNNPECKIATPRIDRLATEGMRFTDAHTTSSVCTPTRYAILTGRYNWRSRLQTGVLGGLSERLIEPGRLTVAEMLRQEGYDTACIGKWHLGMDWTRKPATKAFGDVIEKGPEGWNVDFTKPITNGPNSVGFDYYFGIAASLDMIPYTYIENDRVAVVPTIDNAFPMMRGKDSTTRRGPAAAGFDAMDVLPDLTRKAVEYIGERANCGKPFFLYLPLASPHTPIAPSPQWQGRSGLNPYADFVMETDDCVGQVLDALERNGVDGKTLVFFASDNGCSPEADFPALAEKGHEPSHIYRGHKADIWDGGHRVPFLVRRPGQVKAGATSDQLVSLVDFQATCADVTGTELPDNAAEDSVSLLPILLDEAKEPVREALVHHSINGKFSIRQGRWKLELCPGSGGWSVPRDPQAARQGLPGVQLYDMEADPEERKNLEAELPEVVEQLTALLERYVADGRSTPGEPQENAVAVDIWKQ